MDAALHKELFDLAKTIIERLSSAPFIALVLILLFKKQLKMLFQSVSAPLGRVVDSLLSRSFKVDLNKQGLKLEAGVASAVTTQEAPPSDVTKGLPENKTNALKPSATPERVQAVKNIDVSPIVVEQQNLIRADLIALGMSENEQIDILIKHLAVTQLCLRAEIVYREIFGSQIALMKFLNRTSVGTRAQLLLFYEEAKSQFPNIYESYSFDQYLTYLLSRGLVLTERNEEYSLTIAGKEFLKWLTETNLGENKLF